MNFALEQSGQIAEIVVIAWHQFSHPFVKKMKISAIQNEMVEWKKKGCKSFVSLAIKKTIEKTRELRPRLEDVFEDDVHLMVRLFNPLQKNRERVRVQLIAGAGVLDVEIM